MIVITGRQRSFTTLIAEALALSGYDVGSTYRDEVGGYDNDLVCAFYRTYLGDDSFPFSTYSSPLLGKITSAHFMQMEAQVIKFCYLLMNPHFVSIWHKWRADCDDKFLVLRRDPKSVWLSKTRKWGNFQHDSAALQQIPTVMRYTYWTSLKLLRKWYPVEVLRVPEQLNYQSVNAALARLDPDVQINSTIWWEVFDPTKIHF